MASSVPRQFFIVPDPKAEKLTPVVFGAYPYEAGAYVSAAVANIENGGNLQAFGTGNPTSNFDAEIRIQRGGDATSAYYVYRDQGGTQFDYYGEPDRRFMRDVHNPMPNITYKGFGATAFYAPLHNRECVLIADMFQRDRVRIMYRDVNSTAAREDGGGWTQELINLKTSFQRGLDYSGHQATDAAMIDACTRDDGTVFIVVKHKYDLDIYQTEDGINWELTSAGILSNFINIDPYPNTADLPNTYGRLGQLFNVKIAASGDFLRIAYAGYSNAASDIFIKVLGSSNSGASWTLIEDDKTTEATGISGGDRFGFDIVGLRNGQFMMTATDQYYMMNRFYLGSGMGGFTYVSSLSILWNPSIGGNQAPRFYLAMSADWLYCIMDNSLYDTSRATGNSFPSSVAPEINMFWIDLETSITEGVVWNNMGYKKYTTTSGAVEDDLTAITGFQGIQRFCFARGKLYNRGDSLALFAGLFDNQSTQDVSLIGPIYMRFGGWSKRPVDAAKKYTERQNSSAALIDVRLNPVNGAIQRGRLFNVTEWRTAFGAPAGVLYASAISTWEEVRAAGNPTRNWNSNRLKITKYSNMQSLFYRWTDPTQGYNSNSSKASEQIAQHSLGFYALNYHPDYRWIGENTVNPATNATVRNPLGTVNGSCILFTCRVTSGGQRGHTPNTNTFLPRGAGMQIESYVYATISPNAAEQTLMVNLNLDTTGIDICDVNASTILEQITIADLDTDFYEFRFAMRPAVTPNGVPILIGTQLVECCLAWRKVGTDVWYNSNAHLLQTSPLKSSRRQRVTWGAWQQNSGDPAISEWRDFCIHGGTDLGVFPLRTSSTLYPDCVRGRRTSTERVRLDEGVDIVWGGAAATVGDEYTLTTEYTNGFRNANIYDSPRMRWSSGIATNTNIARLETVGGDKKEGIVHSAIAVFGTNAKKVQLNYGSTWGATLEIDLKRADGRIEQVEDNAVRVVFDTQVPAAIFSSSFENRKFFARLTNVPNTLEEDTGYLISRHYYDRNNQHWIECAGVTMSFDVTGIVGSTISIYSDRGWAVNTGINVDDRVQWTLLGSAWNPYEDSNKKQELYAGRLIVGTTLSMHPLQMSWNYTDQETANVSVNRSRSGITWGYCEGASTRVIKGEFQGDVSEQVRRYVRDTLRAATKFNERGLVFVGYEDDANGPLADDYFMLARFDDNIALQNVGWYYDDETQKWRPVGNLTLTLTEIV